MIFSIRHKILLPFFCIIVCMTFIAVFVAIKFVTSHFNNVLVTHVHQRQIQIEHSISQIISYSYNQYYYSDTTTSSIPFIKVLCTLK